MISPFPFSVAVNTGLVLIQLPSFQSDYLGKIGYGACSQHPSAEWLQKESEVRRIGGRKVGSPGGSGQAGGHTQLIVILQRANNVNGHNE